MTSAAIELFYSYAHADETLRNELNEHLSLLKRQGLISEWHDREITAGTLWAKEIDTHLQTAHVILLLISPAFLASDYCYGIELQAALKRHAAGDAVVIPVILRQCDWEAAPFGEIQALPKNAKPVKMWSDRDAAFTDVAKGIRKVIEQLHGNSTAPTTRNKHAKTGNGMGERKMPNIPTTIGTSALKTNITHYYKELEGYKGKAVSETSLRSAFQNLLAETARNVNWTLIPEQTLEGNIRPDGVLRDSFDLRRGFWEAKGPEGNLEQEITKKIAAGYPLTNTIFENTRRAVLYQSKKRLFEYQGL